MTEVEDMKKEILAGLDSVKNSTKSEVQSKLDQLTKDFYEKLDEKGKAWMGDIMTKMEETNRRVDTLEAERKGERTQETPKADVHKEAFMKFVRYGKEALSADEIKLMHTGDIGTGFFATPEISNEIVKGITHFSPLRQVAKVMTINAKSYMYPSMDAHTTAAWVGELEARTIKGDLGYEMSEIPTEECYTYVGVSKQNLEDTTINLEAEISQDFGRAFGLLEGTAFLSGTGVKQPEGIMKLDAAGEHTAILDETSSADADNFTMDNLMDMKAALDSYYLPNAKWMMHPLTWNYICKMKNAVSGDYRIQPRVTQEAGDMLLGYPVVFNYEMEPPDEAGGVFAAHDHPVMFGDFQRCYTIVDRVGTQFQRFEESVQWKAGIVEFVARRRLGGQVVDHNAVKVLITHA